MLSYYLLLKPFREYDMHILEVYNEIVILVSFYFLQLWTKFVPHVSTQFHLGQYFSYFVIAPLFFFNLFRVIVVTTKKPYLKAKGACLRAKHKYNEKKLEAN